MRRYTACHEAAHAVTGVMLGCVPTRVLITGDGGGINLYPGGVRADEFTPAQAVAVAGGHRLAAVVQLMVLHAGGMGEVHAMTVAGVPLADQVATSWVTCAGDRHAIGMLDRVCGPLDSSVLVGLHRSVVGPWWQAISAVATVLEICGHIDGRSVAAIVASDGLARQGMGP